MILSSMPVSILRKHSGRVETKYVDELGMNVGFLTSIKPRGSLQ